MIRRPPRSTRTATLLPYTTLFRSRGLLQLAVNAIDPALRPAEPLLGRDNSSEPLLPSITPANFSAYLNTSVNLLYRDRGGVTPPDVFLFGAARYRDVVLEFDGGFTRSEEHTSELQSLMRHTYAVFC